MKGRIKIMKVLTTVEVEHADILELFMINSIRTLFRQNREEEFTKIHELLNHDLAEMDSMYSILSKFDVKTTSDSITITKASDNRFIAKISDKEN
jgi:hypothetical protein